MAKKKETTPEENANPAEFAITPQNGVSKDQINELVQRKVLEVLAGMSMNNYSNNGGVVSPAGNGLNVSLDYLDEDDILREPHMFYKWTVGGSIYDDRKYGKIDPHPFRRPVKFEHIATIKYGQGNRDTKFIQISRAEIHSKKERDWLKHHSEYGVSFYDEMKDVNKIDFEARAIEFEAAERLKNMGQMEVVNLAKEKKLPFTTDLTKMRLMLIPILAADIAKEKQIMRRATVIGTDVSAEQYENLTGNVAQQVMK